MQLQRTLKESLTPDEVKKYVLDHIDDVVPELDKLWAYYKGRNTTILDREKPDESNPDNRTPVPYGRKIVTTYTGYAFRPHYITYKSANEPYMTLLQDVFNRNVEHIKTSRNGRNTAVFGVGYDLLYIAGENNRALPRFFPVDPREIILLYDYSPEPEKKIGIRHYEIDDNLIKVEVYYPERVEFYDLMREQNGNWRIVATGTTPNFFSEVPIVPYYAGDEMLGIIKPVLPLIDDYDLLVSDSLNEFDRFSHAYLLLKRMYLVDPQQKKDPASFSRALNMIKRRRIFENLQENSDVSFLTKDIPKEFVEFMTNLVREQIHVQSHVPDFTSDKMAGNVSGIAIQRLMFDFENLVSSNEADFDVGLMERIRLITEILARAGNPVGDPDEITISHKRNVPLNLKEFAETAEVMKRAGFSDYLIADVMPDDVIPDVEEELARQEEQRAMAIPAVDDMPDPDEMEDGDDTGSRE